MTTAEQFSEQLNAYLAWVRSETGRDVLIQEVDDVGLGGMSFAFRRHDTHIDIIHAKLLQCSQRQFEQSIAHEATHGLLLYGWGYADLRPTAEPRSEYVTQAIGIMATMIDDVVVNKVIADHGFAPYGEVYPSMVNQETKAARKRQMGFYATVSKDETVRCRFRVYRYVTARAFREFYSLPTGMGRKLGKFGKAFRIGYPEDADEGDWIVGLMVDQDVLSPKGHRRVLSEVVKRWDLTRFADLSPAV